MNQPSDTPMVSYSNAPIPWSEAMVYAMTKPAPETYAELAHNPNTNISTGLLWIFGGGVITAVLGVILGLLLGGYSNLDTRGISTSAAGISLLCIAPLAGIFAVLGFCISTGIQNIVAKALGGTGTYEQLVYAESAFTAPFAVVRTILAAIPIINLLNLVLGLYTLVLSASAIKGVHNLSWGKAIVSLLVIPVLILIVVVVAVVMLLVILGPSIGNIFSNIQRNL